MSKTTDLSLIERKKEAIKQLPKYRGEVPSKNAIRKLPNVNIGEIFWVDMDDKPYIVSDISPDRLITIQALDETATISTGMTVYDLNKKLVSQEPLFNWNDKTAVEGLNEKLQKWFEEETQDTYYLLYGRNIHYVTLIKKNKENPDNLFKNLKEMIEEFSELISIDIDETDEEKKVEIWVRTEFEKAELLYLFPYDSGLVEI